MAPKYITYFPIHTPNISEIINEHVVYSNRPVQYWFYTFDFSALYTKIPQSTFLFPNRRPITSVVYVW